MADRQVVLSAPLFFLFTKFGKLEIKRIKTALVDFYPSEEIKAAKERLIKDAQALSLDGMPTIARRRNIDNRYQRECDDMVDIITFLDERKVLSLFAALRIRLLRSFSVSPSGRRRHALALA